MSGKQLGLLGAVGGPFRVLKEVRNNAKLGVFYCPGAAEATCSHPHPLFFSHLTSLLSFLRHKMKNLLADPTSTKTYHHGSESVQRSHHLEHPLTTDVAKARQAIHLPGVSYRPTNSSQLSESVICSSPLKVRQCPSKFDSQATIHISPTAQVIRVF